MEYSKKVSMWLGLIAVLFIIILTCHILMQGERRTEDNAELINFSQALIVQKYGCNFTALDINNKYSPSPLNIEENFDPHEICSFDMYLQNTLFYNKDFRLIKSTSKNYSDIILPSNHYSLSEFDETHKYEIAVDFLNKKIYGISLNNKFESDKLIVTDFYGHHYTILTSNLNTPKHIVLDPRVGQLFIGQLSSIIRMNMDGTFITIIVEKYGITELAIDRYVKRIYWANSITIESSNYEGGDRRIVSSIPDSIRSLTIVGNRLYWISHNSTIVTCNKDFLTKTCGPLTTIPFDKPRLIKAYDFDEMKGVNSINDCEKNEYDCLHLCLLNGIDGSNCVCDLGYYYDDKYSYILGRKYKKCTLTTNEFLLYAQGNYFKGFNINNHQNLLSTDIIYPNHFTTTALEKKRIISMDYDFRNNYVFFADDYQLSHKKLKIGENQIDLSVKFHIISIATDWVAKLIYCTGTEVSYSKHNCIRVYSYNSFKDESDGYKTILRTDEHQKIHDIVIHPNLGLVFFTLENTTTNSSKSQIYKMNADGTDLKIFLENFFVKSFGLAIDYSTDVLHWLTDKQTKLDGTHVSTNEIYSKYILIENFIWHEDTTIKDPITINVFNNRIYISNLTSIWSLKNGIEKQIVDSTQMGGMEAIASSKIFSRKAQPVVDGHPCAINNGGCQSFCFAVPTSERKLQRQCECEYWKTLQFDQKSCA